MAALGRKENKPVSIDAAMKRFEADVQDLLDSGETEGDLEAVDKEKLEVKKYMETIDKLLKKDRDKDAGMASESREFLQRYEIERLLKKGGPFPSCSYTPKELETILSRTLAWEGPEVEKPVSCLGATGYIARINDSDELDKSDIFVCTVAGKDKGGNPGIFVEGQILRAEGLKVKDLRIVEVLGNGRTGKFRLSGFVLHNSKDSPGTSYCAETPPSLVKRYNTLSFRAAKIAFDEEKKMGGVKPTTVLTKEQILGLSAEQSFEFKIAFDLVAEEYQPGITSDPDNVSIPEEKIPDVFLALGLTMMDHDLEYIIENSYPNAQGLYMCADLIEAFDQWKQRQLSYDNLKSVFNTLVSTQKLPGTFEHTKPYANKISGDARLPSEALKNALNSALHLDGDSKLKLHEIKGVEDEISSNAQNHISLKDFVEIFRT